MLSIHPLSRCQQSWRRLVCSETVLLRGVGPATLKYPDPPFGVAKVTFINLIVVHCKARRRSGMRDLSMMFLNFG